MRTIPEGIGRSRVSGLRLAESGPAIRNCVLLPRNAGSRGREGDDVGTERFRQQIALKVSTQHLLHQPVRKTEQTGD